MKFHRPIIATSIIAASIAAGSTAYAAVGGMSGIRALFAGQKNDGAGSRIVQVDTQNCPHVDAFNAANHNRMPNASYYYRIKAGSSLTNEQVVEMVQGACEADAEGIANGNVEAAIEALPENKDKLIGGYIDSVVTALTPSSLSISSVVPYISNNIQTNHTINQTFGHIDPNVTVIADGVRQPFSSLKVGDHVSVVYRATGDALTHSETIAPDQVDTSAQTVVIVTRVSQHMSDYVNFQKYHNREIEEVTPCSSTADGYCTIEQYQNK